MPGFEGVGDFDEVGDGIATLANAVAESGVAVSAVFDEAEGGEGIKRNAGGEEIGSEGISEEVC